MSTSLSQIESNWAHLDQYFTQALKISEGERKAFCQTVCGDDLRLFELLWSLVDAAQMDDERIRNSVSQIAAHAAKEESLTGELLGAYRIDELLARGGMGDVYMASRADGEYEKQVVIKVIMLKLNHDEFVLHFKTERQVLASLSHLYIPSLLDAGQLEDGRPYFVTEFIKGVPIDRYCERHALSTNERIALIEKLCDAVQHAHSQFVLHLDIKPGNVLVVEDGTPRLLDFGVARLMGDVETGHAAFTPRYASPEQIEGERLTAASDIYSLGVLTYRVLTNLEPFDSSPFSPSQTLLAERTALHTDITNPVDLSGLSGDLKAILQKAMAPTSGERYAGVESLKEDLRRFRNHLPVAARSSTWSYRMGKFLRRHAVSAFAIAVVIATLAVLGVREFQLRTQAQTAFAKAEREAEAMRQVSTFLADMFAVSDPGEARGNSVTARELLDKGSARIAEDLAGQPAVAARMMHVMGDVYRKLGLYSQASSLLDKSLELQEAEEVHDKVEIARTLHSLGVLHRTMSRFDPAEAMLKRSLDIRRKVYFDDHVELAESWRELGNLYMRQGRYEEADNAHLHGLEVRARVQGVDHPDYASQQSELGMVYADQGRHEESEALYLASIEALESAWGANDPNLANYLERLGNFYNMYGRAEEGTTYLLRSLAMRKQVLVADHPLTALTQSNLAAAYITTGNYDEAEVQLRKAINIFEQHFEPDDHRLANSRYLLAEALLYTERVDEAKQNALNALAAFESRLSPDHHFLGFNHELLARIFSALHDDTRAGDHYAAAWDNFSKRPSDDPVRMKLATDYANFLGSSGREEDAEVVLAEP